MPSNLPVHVFITHMTKYILSNLVVWLRALLVGCVWLCWLPYLMRRMWSLLFWLSDEGLGSLLLAKTAGSSSVTNATLDAIESANATSSLFDNATSIQDAASAIVTSALNGSATDPTSDIAAEPTRLFLFLLKAIFPPNVSFLRNLTRQPAINRFIIMVLEGQIITVLVIVCFILIILVRDYVVQQQPEINMRAAFAGQEVARLDEPTLSQMLSHIAEGHRTRRTSAMDAARPPKLAQQQHYLRVYREANGDPEVIMRLLREESVRNRTQARTPEIVNGHQHPEASNNSGSSSIAAATSSRQGSGERVPTQETYGDRSGMDDVFGPAMSRSSEEMEGRDSMSSRARSKQPVWPEQQEEFLPVDDATGEHDDEDLASYSRRRAVSDGPQPHRHEFSGTFGGSDREDAFEDDEDGEAARSDIFNDHAEERDQGVAQEINVEAAPAGPAPPAPNADFFWGGIEPPTEDELRAAEAEDEDLDDDDAAEDIGVDNGEPGEAGEAGAQALDQDALDDIEDFEGIMELIGMRGPIAGLFQNAVFCACLVFVAIFVCIFLPYNLGRTAICIAANPMRLVRMLFSAAKFIQDLTAVIAGALSWATLSALSVLSRVTGQNARMDSVGSSITYTWELTANASSRLSSGFFDDFPFHASEIQNFSAVSHGALLELKAHVVGVAMTLWNTAAFTVESPVSEVASTVLSNGTYLAGLAKNMTVTAATSILTPGSWIIDLNTAAPVQIDPALASWSGSDRFWAILAGYLSFASLATLYVTRGAPLSSGQLGQDWEASLVDLINQASGVTKVILIIGIEMLVFPLYCGLLMDAALLPLFEHATIRSRYDFSVNYPLTSIFVHWFVGTGYMFHFALFVSMCRKIMRNGVLYFIRDPDDPEFHPVRDVLERNFFTQLRKIMFSALVYGGLVVVCLGGVVWSLSFASTVLPIHYSSNEPVLEFPVDLLFYNFLMPLAVRVLRPSDALHAMYTWWFKQCARMLRLTWFLFGQRQVDEEGKLLLPKNSPYKSLPWYRKQFLRLDGENNVVPKTWNDLINDLLNPDPSSSSTVGSLTKTKRKLVREGQLRRDGRFVRTPASDQVRIPKGRRVFLEVHEISQIPLPTAPHLEQYFTDQYQLVYLPPTSGHVRTNDIYAFSIGIYVLGTIGYSVLRAQALSTKIRAWATAGLGALYEPGAPKQVATVVLHGVQLVYTYLNVFVFFPLLASALIELYLIIPLHTYMSPPKAPVMTGADAVPDVGAALAAANSIHTIRAVQAWTLGLLYLKLATRVLRSSFAGTRLANASQAVFRRGWLRPDVKVLTRAFVIPAIALCVIAVAAPPVVIVPLIKRVLVAAGAFDRLSDDPVSMALIYRLSFLSAALVALSSTMVWSLVGVFRGGSRESGTRHT
ncbi:unnamed protein product [Parascedosporium putredinis]|uniref:RING-type E3 ubiquitin transferase n=1 Tax=Parascedosporium putredinis TaxID=1442378 RepID=A0A9P1H8T1_9PEZI|nr:unnamed protein product [Parascedosporium putredinis]CAI8000146.1 unnamed protein product [Parascedosporium putredinis]